MTDNVMTPNHPQWQEFYERLGGEVGSRCDGSRARPLATAILQDMGVDAATSLAYFERRGGYCDCEILFNVAE